MTDREKDSDSQSSSVELNPGYAVFQIAKLLKTSAEHEDSATRDRAQEKAAKWEVVLENLRNGLVTYGSREPLKNIPAWATLEVLTGGFATGELLAAGPLHKHENRLLEKIPSVQTGQERLALNSYFLTDSGLSELQEWIVSGCYEISVPEEGALLVVAWLAHNGYPNDARQLIETISPFFSKLRFYPIPLEQPKRSSSRVYLQDVGTTAKKLGEIKPNKSVLAQKTAIEIWLPLYDCMVAMFFETTEGDLPCQRYPEGWAGRAIALLDEHESLKKEHIPSRKMERANGHAAQLRNFLSKCARTPEEITEHEVGRIRTILNCYSEKRGEPTSDKCSKLRLKQAEDVSAPLFHRIAKIVIERLSKHTKSEGLDNVEHLNLPLTQEESSSHELPEGASVPRSVQRKVEYCLNETVDVLVERGLITSGDTLAKVLPQVSADIRAKGIIDSQLSHIYSEIYCAFRRRRSLLLLNLETQVQIEELPWVKAIEQFRSDSLSTQHLTEQTLKEITALTLTSFPHAILPNKLLQELRALVKSAKLDLPLVDELAADIFMGSFSGKFVASARKAGEVLNGTLYAKYYEIEFEEILKIPGQKKKRRWMWRDNSETTDEFANICASRSGVSLGSWDTAANGMIIEQQQILTTQNLAALYLELGLSDDLQDQLLEMAKQSFQWICERQQMKIDEWHARMIMVKNTAYAWRQMLFFLAVSEESDVNDFVVWADDYFKQQSHEFRARFNPAFKGLLMALGGNSINSDDKARQFLGWSNKGHWMLAN